MYNEIYDEGKKQGGHVRIVRVQASKHDVHIYTLQPVPKKWSFKGSAQMHVSEVPLNMQKCSGSDCNY